MAFSSSQRNQFSRRNVAFGQEGAEKRRKQLSDYANMLQELRNQGQMNLQDDQQEFDLPAQEAMVAKIGAETEGLGIANEGQRFFQGLSEQYGPTAMRQELGLPEPVSRANVFFPERVSPLRAKSDVSDTRIPGSAGPGSEYNDSWRPKSVGRNVSTPASPGDRDFYGSPISRMFDLENVVDSTKKLWKGLDYTGRKMQGIGKYMWDSRGYDRRKRDEPARF